MAKSDRLANFELLRILAMFMVVILHFNLYHGLLPALSDPLTGRQIYGAALEAFCVVAVNVYIMISGYVMIRSEFKISRMIRLVCQVLFYTLLVPLVLFLLGIPVLAQRDGLYGWLKYVFPISTGHYWFVTEYVILFLWMPFLNAACLQLKKRQLGILLGLLLLFFCVGKSILPLPMPMDRFGYDFGWFLCLYLTGGYIRLYGLPFLQKGKRGWLLWGGSCLLIFLLVLGIHSVYQSSGHLAYYFKLLYHYNFIFCYLGGVGLFCGFSGITIKEGKAAALFRRVGPLCLGVYLLHMQTDIMERGFLWTHALFGKLDQGGLPGLILYTAVTVIFIFLAGIAVDGLRSRIFALAEGVWKRRKG